MQYLSDGDVTFGKFGKLLNEFPGIGSATNSYKKKSFVYKFKCTPTHTHNDESELSWGPFIDFKYSFYFRNWRTYWVCFSLLLVVFYSICIRPKFNFGLCQWFNLKQILNECLIHIPSWRLLVDLKLSYLLNVPISNFSLCTKQQWI